MPSPTELTAAEKKKILEYEKNGLNGLQIANKIGRGKTVVYKFLKIWREEKKEALEPSRIGAPAYLSEREKDFILELSQGKANYFRDSFSVDLIVQISRIFEDKCHANHLTGVRKNHKEPDKHHHLFKKLFKKLGQAPDLKHRAAPCMALPCVLLFNSDKRFICLPIAFGDYSTLKEDINEAIRDYLDEHDDAYRTESLRYFIKETMSKPPKMYLPKGATTQLEDYYSDEERIFWPPGIKKQGRENLLAGERAQLDKIRKIVDYFGWNSLQQAVSCSNDHDNIPSLEEHVGQLLEMCKQKHKDSSVFAGLAFGMKVTSSSPNYYWEHHAATEKEPTNGIWFHCCWKNKRIRPGTTKKTLPVI